jgi:hypothetical protein
MALERDVDWSFLDLDYMQQKYGLVDQLRPPLFLPGRMVVTPGARAVFAIRPIDAEDLLSMHVRGLWGEVSEEDADRNWAAVEQRGGGEPIVSVYEGNGPQFTIIIRTEGDRGRTTVLTPEEY